MSEDSSTQMHQRLVEMQVEYILNRKRLEMLIEPGHIYTQDELQELVHLASSVSAYSAVQAMMEEVASTLISKGLTAAFGESVANQILQQEVASILQLAAAHEDTGGEDSFQSPPSPLRQPEPKPTTRLAFIRKWAIIFTVVTILAGGLGFISGFLFKQLFLCPNVDARSDIIALVRLTPVAR